MTYDLFISYAHQGDNSSREAVAALELQTRSLEIALKRREQNPNSFFYQRTAAVSFFLTFQRARAAGNQRMGATLHEIP